MVHLLVVLLDEIAELRVLRENLADEVVEVVGDRDVVEHLVQQVGDVGNPLKLLSAAFVKVVAVANAAGLDLGTLVERGLEMLERVRAARSAWRRPADPFAVLQWHS